MYNSGYVLNDLGNFLWRRYIRLAPPAYCSIILTFIQYFGAIYMLGRAIKGYFEINISPEAILANLTFTIPFTHYKWYNPIFWTLAIEFQYYIFIGLTFYLFVNSNLVTRYAVFISTIIISLLISYFKLSLEFFNFSAFFLLGIVLFLFKISRLSKVEFIVITLLITLFGVYQHGLMIFGTGLLTLLAIASFQFKSKIASYFGKISYSLYLTHVVMSIYAEALLKRIIPVDLYQDAKIILLFVYLGICILFAHVFYMLMEKPFIKLSSNFRKSRTRVAVKNG